MQLHVRLNDDQLKRYQNQIAALGEGKARVGIARAVNRVTRSAQGKVIRAIAKQTSIPRAIVRKGVRISLAAHKGTEPIQGVIYSSGYPVPMKYFGAKQFSFGVRAKIWGESQRFPSYFINAGRWNSGNPVANGHVFKRVGSSRLPIEKQDGPSIPEGMVAGESVHAFQSTVEAMLPPRISHELGRLLGI